MHDREPDADDAQADAEKALHASAFAALSQGVASALQASAAAPPPVTYTAPSSTPHSAT